MEKIISTGVLKKVIALDDLPLVLYYKTEPKDPITIGGQTYPQNLHMPAVKTQEVIPEELKILTIGTTVYFVLSESHDPVNGNNFKKIKLSINPGAKTFEVHYRCFE